MRTRQPFLAALSATYLFSSLIIIPYIITFPNLSSIHSWPHVGLQTIPWLWTFWHIGFPVGIFASMVLEHWQKGCTLSLRHTTITIILTPALIIVLVAALCFIAINYSSWLPVLVVKGNYSRTSAASIGLLIIVLHLAATALCLFQLRRGMVLHIWLSVAAVAALLDVILSWWAGNYFNVGWYLARFSSLIAATVVLAVLLYKVNQLYVMVAQQNDQLEQQREDLKKQNQLHERQNQMQKDFVSIVGHEFRTALTTIQGFGEVIAEEALTYEEIKEYVSDMCSEAQRLNRLITEQLDLDRMRSGQMQLKAEVVDLNKLIEATAQRICAQSPRHALQLDLERSLPSLWADRDRLTQVLLNLLSNAIKYSPQGGQIQISTMREGACIHVTVQDQGIGIPSEKLEQIFEQYTRVDAESSRYIGGTGLGLSVVQQIVQMHGGTITVESVIGTGSTFHIRLPLVRVPLLAELVPAHA